MNLPLADAAKSTPQRRPAALPRPRAAAAAQRRMLGSLALLSGPTYLWLLVTIFLPLMAMLYFSFLSIAPIAGPGGTFTLAHYVDIFSKPVYLINLKRSLLLGLQVTFFCVLIGYPAAYLLARKIKNRWREAILLLVVLPFWSNALVRTFSWTMVLSDNGLLGQLLHFIWPNGPSLDLLYSYKAIVIGLVHAYLPYMILTCYVSLQAIDGTLAEAALSLGASHRQVFQRIVLPLSLPGLVAGSILIFVPVIGCFMEPRILGGQQGITFGTIIESQFTTSFNWPLGAAMGFVLLAVVLLVMALFFPLLRKHLT